MNKKYMDFVPASATRKVVKKQPKAVVDEPKPAVRRVAPETNAKKQPSLNELDKKRQAMNLPKPTFVNTEKINKRPLSKNVYQKKIETPEEKPSAPVTIINKPEKDSKVGLIVTIIITIILGAAAGTVAFLLLPK